MVSKKILPSQRVLVEVRSNFHLYFQSKVHDIVLVLVHTGEHEICSVTPKKVLYPLPRGAQRRLKRKNTLPLQLLFTLKLLMMWGLLKCNFLMLCPLPAVPFELVDLGGCCTDSDVITITKSFSHRQVTIFTYPWCSARSTNNSKDSK